MRVVITVPTFPPYNSGLGNAVASQARMLAARGADVVVCTGGEARDGARAPGGFAVERFPVAGADWLANPVRGDVGAYLGFLQSSRADLILLNAWQTWSTDVVLRHLASLPGRKAVYSHGLATSIHIAPQPVRSALRYLLWRPYRWRLPRVLRAIDGLIALAPSGCDSRFDDVRLAARLGIPIYVVPNALPDYALDGQGGPPGRADRSTLIAVGAYETAKGHDFVLRAYAGSSARNRIPLRFYGQRETSVTAGLRRLAARLGIEERFATFNTGVSGAALFAEYRRAIAVLCGSHTECQPLVLLDALAAGTPFVARASGCIPGMAGGVAVRTIGKATTALDAVIKTARWNELSAAGATAAGAVYHPSVVEPALWSAVEHIIAARGGR
jgi:glycosyltransferase involved in cell wall biosynthesis